MLNLRETTFSLHRLETEHISVPEPLSKFDMTLYAQVMDDDLHFTIVYNVDLFHRARMVEFLRQLKFLLAQIVASPQKRILDYSLVTSAARRILPNPNEKLDATWQGPVHKDLAATAEKLPGTVAMVDNSRVWTYRELDSESNRLANCLHSQGLAAGDVVAIYADRSGMLVVTILAVLKAHAAFLILDPADPAPRLANYIQQAQPGAFIKTFCGDLPQELSECLSSIGCALRLEMNTDFSQQTLAQYPNCQPDNKISPDDLAFVPECVRHLGKYIRKRPR